MIVWFSFLHYNEFNGVRRFSFISVCYLWHHLIKIWLKVCLLIICSHEDIIGCKTLAISVWSAVVWVWCRVLTSDWWMIDRSEADTLRKRLIITASLYCVCVCVCVSPVTLTNEIEMRKSSKLLLFIHAFYTLDSRDLKRVRDILHIKILYYIFRMIFHWRLLLRV